MIPNIVHQTWRSTDLPIIFQKIYESNKKLNPNFEFKLWSHSPGNPDIDNFIQREYPDIFEIFQKTKYGVQKADIARLLILYHYGGIYIDLDILCLKNIENIVDLNTDNVLLCMEPDEQTKSVFNKENVLCNAFMATPAKHPLFKQAIEEIKNVYTTHGDVVFKIFNSFGADILTKSILISDENYDYCKFLKRDLIYPICDPKLDNLPKSERDISRLKIGKYGNAVMVHYWIHSDFESKELLEKFNYDDTKDINENVYTFFKQLYKNNKYLN